MLFPVIGSRTPFGSRRLRWLQALVLGTALAGAALPARTALAQEADDNGWFDAPTTPPPPDPDYGAPAPDPGPAPAAAVSDTDPSALTTFKPALDPYGAWVADPTYGTVWVPHREVVGEDFAPYVSRGHWALTADDDWIWVSDYPFGWAVFHYGRWVWISGHGWAWVPGRTYANAWVVWRVPSASYAYVGWAPMPPTWGWYNGYAVGLWWSPPLPYVFCPSAYVFDYRVHYHIVHDRRLVGDIARNSRVYPTPYHAPARPGVHGGAPGVRTASIAPSGVPRGPQMAAARVPSQAIPVTRTAAPPNAARLSGPSATRVFRSSDAGRANLGRERFVPDARTRSSVPRPSPSPRPYGPSDSFSRPSRQSFAPPRASVPDRVRVQPRSVAPAPRVRVSPSMSHSFSPPSHSFSPPRGGGSFRRR
jgi:hypothetical protein